MKTLTTAIKRWQFLREIVAGTKTIEYREPKPYWDERLSTMSRLSSSGLINGMAHDAPEATMVVTKVRKNVWSGYYELHLGEILDMKDPSNLVGER